jgi:RimJ/RimL family protein N-acetyltransferase
MDLILRNARLDDSTLLLAWRNSPDARKFSSSTEEISLESHRAWLKQRIARQDNEPFWIIELSHQLVGFIRLDLKRFSDSTFVISILIDNDFRGAGIGQAALKLMQNSLGDSRRFRVLAKVHKNNIASKSLFEKSGFTVSEIGLDFLEYELTQ